jgi:hypothetical protein
MRALGLAAIVCRASVAGHVESQQAPAIGETVFEIHKSCWAIFQDKDGNHWFSSDGMGVSRYDGKTILVGLGNPQKKLALLWFPRDNRPRSGRQGRDDIVALEQAQTTPPSDATVALVAPLLQYRLHVACVIDRPVGRGSALGVKTRFRRADQIDGD